MSRWRIVLVLALLVLPVLTLAGAGSFYLWREGLMLIAWWPLIICMATGYYLALRWHRKNKLLRPVDYTPPELATARDRDAWAIIEARAKAGSTLDSDTLSDPEHYLRTAQELGAELARFYFPRTKDPVGGLTIPEMLAVIELAAHDLAEMVDRYLPGGHLLSIDDWRRAKKATDWYSRASNVYWIVSAIFSPVNTAVRYAATQAGLTQPWQMLQQNLLLWFYQAYLHRLGHYLIELYSGRLRVGAKRWREVVHGKPALSAADEVAGAEPPAEARQVILTLFGQVKAGKSSLVNAILGERMAETDVLPATALVQRYRLRPADVPAELVLLDTVGYGHTGPKQDQIEATREAARQADVLFLVLHARDPARAADVQMLKSLREWFDSRPDLRMPPVLAVLTHIDLLSPSLEWQPPYDWQNPTRPKEESIAGALEAAREQLGPQVIAVLPVCAAPGKVFGIDEAVLPALATRLDEARAVSVLRCLRSERDTRKVRKVFEQLLAVGKGLVRAVWEDWQEKPPPR